MLRRVPGVQKLGAVVLAAVLARGCVLPAAENVAGEGGAAGSGGTGGGCCATSDAPKCNCGCPSLFQSGAFESEPQVQAFDFDCGDTKSFVTDEGCGVLELTGSTAQHCGRKEGVAPQAAGGKCVFGRIRIKSSDGGSVALGVDGDSFQGILEENPPTGWATYTASCRLPDPYNLTEAFLNVNQGSGSPGATVSLDFVEIFVATCLGPELACQ